jgi:hypothetical protein
MLDEWTDAVREAQRRIDHGWYAALCALVFRGFLGGLVVTNGGGSFLSQVPYLGVLLGLAIGVAYRSRIAAALLVVQALWIDGGLAWQQRSVFAGLLLVGFGYFYVSSLVGTVRYHQLQHARPVPPAGKSNPASAQADA